MPSFSQPGAARRHPRQARGEQNHSPPGHSSKLVCGPRGLARLAALRTVAIQGPVRARGRSSSHERQGAHLDMGDVARLPVYFGARATAMFGVRDASSTRSDPCSENRGDLTATSRRGCNSHEELPYLYIYIGETEVLIPQCQHVLHWLYLPFEKYEGDYI